MKIYIPFVSLVFILGCSKGSNPVEFSKIQNKGTVTAAEVPPTGAPETQAPKKLTLLEMYLAKKVTRDYMVSWFFKDITIYRDKLFYIKYEIEDKKPLSEYDMRRIIYLEDGMNQLIKRFNSKNGVKRSAAFLSALVQTQRKKDERYIEYTMDELEIRGAPAGAISNSPSGFLGSFVRYGFHIELVDFLGRR